VIDPFESTLARLAERAPAPAESGRTTFRLPPRAADALAWLTAQLRSTQKDVLAGLPDVVEDLRGTGLWERLGALIASGPEPAATPAPARLMAADTSWDSVAYSRHDEPHLLIPSMSSAPPRMESGEPDPGERSTYVLPRDALEKLTRQSDSLGLPRDEVVARALVALRAAVEVRQAGRPGIIRSLRPLLDDLTRLARRAAGEAVALPPHDPIRADIERASAHLANAGAALHREPDPDA
jgi:hypothetical protein